MPCVHGETRTTCMQCARDRQWRYRNSPHGKERCRDYNRGWMRRQRKNRV
jgi:hypothetical protein